MTRTHLLRGQAEREWASLQPEDALINAVMAGDAGLARRLLAARPDLRDKRGEYCITPLMEAALNGHPEVVEVLVDGGAQLDLQDCGGTALWWAAYGNQPAVVRFLVGRGADQTIRGDGRTPREVAVQKGNTECAALLQVSKLLGERGTFLGG